MFNVGTATRGRLHILLVITCMKDLFRIETDKVILIWSGPDTHSRNLPGETETPVGRLVISLRRHNSTFESNTWRDVVPPEVANDPLLHIGPRLYEETNYTVYLRSKTNEKVELRHRDPVILRGLNETDEGKTIHGSINFRGQVGRSLFSVFLGGRPELDFEVEIFPSKLDYTTDYEALLADVQDILTALVLEYLQSTFHLGLATQSKTPTRLEWIILLSHVLEKLERGLRYIEQHPHRSLTNKIAMDKAHSVQKVSSILLKAIIQGKGSGSYIDTRSGVKIRVKLPTWCPRSTLDTPEHRWFATQLARIRKRLAEIHREEKRQASEGNENDKKKKIIKEISSLENRIASLQRIDPIKSATGSPPSGFASLTLQTAPGYKEAYRACLILLKGLRVYGGPVGLSIKEIHLLYEYWCYLSIIRLIADLLGKRIPVERLVAVERDGLKIRLKHGYQSIVSFENDDSRRIEVTYNPTFSKESSLLPQRPDIVLTFHHPDWPPMRLILDAKYRINLSEDYINQFGSPGPPPDAINVLHRYRDAILEESNSEGPRSERVKRSVIEGTALFPYVDKQDNFKSSRLWLSLERLGIGALPFLPSETRYVEEWLMKVLKRGGWSTAERAIPHIAHEQLRSWRDAAKEIVLVAVLRGSNPKEHLDWICSKKLYYTPLTQTQRRQFAARWIAIYSPSSLRSGIGAVTHVAAVEKIEVLKRQDIPTPWDSRQNAEELQVIYHLDKITRLERVIENRGHNGRGMRFSQNRWTSRLGLERAKELRELFMETEPEWRLYEELKAANVKFNIKPGRPTLRSGDDLSGRCWFVIEDLLIQYRGSAGFMIRHKPFSDEYVPTVSAVLEKIGRM